MKAFLYKEELYIRCIPAKSLFNSSLIHQVVNRGDIFALRVSDQTLTIVPGLAAVTHCEINGEVIPPKPTILVKKIKADIKTVLGQMDLLL